MSDEKSLYWLSQVAGWFGYIVLILFTNVVEGEVRLGIIKVLIVNFILGMCLSHFMRFIIIKTGLLNSKIYNLLPRIISLSVAIGIIAAVVYGLISDSFFTDVDPILVMPYEIILELVIPFSTVFLFWNILYFAAIFLKNYEREEVKNLRLTSSMNEVELNNLRSQMNPHFIFNALNSIRALVDENPSLAKKSITQMSHILRSSLASGKKKFVSINEELKVVIDYLELEKIRYEERLGFEIQVDPTFYKFTIPPLLIQTLVENAIKHGIAHLPGGGMIMIKAVFQDDDFIKISVQNSGNLNEPESSRSSTGVGLENSRRRLKLLYGKKAKLSIFNEGDKVVCNVLIPRDKIKN
ncbi:MAG: histidine kinase [Flavobacteriales bacterium]|nr:histidine kinase [Flavobacteriales bacterium]